MPAPYSLDLRRKIVEAYENKEGSMTKIAGRFKVTYAFVQGLIKRFRTEHTIEPKKHKSGNCSPIQDKHRSFIESLFEEKNDMELSEVAGRFEKQFGKKTSPSAVSRALKRLNITRKKTFYDPAKDKEFFQSKVAAFFINIGHYFLEDLIFIDESGAVLNLINNYAYSPRGQKSYSPRPTSKGERISAIGAIAYDKLLSAFCFEGTLNGEVFAYYVKHFLVKDLSPGKAVILDNASPHRNKEAIELIKKTGAEVIYLPPYCPELNPIEHCWSVIKSFLKKLMPRDKESLYHGWFEGLKLITSDLTKACFEHCLL